MVVSLREKEVPSHAYKTGILRVFLQESPSLGKVGWPCTGHLKQAISTVKLYLLSNIL